MIQRMNLYGILSQIETGDSFYLEHPRVVGGIAICRCVNNVDEKLLVEFLWANNGSFAMQKRTLEIIPYDSNKLKNFILLNSQFCDLMIDEEEDLDIDELHTMLTEAILEENYELAKEIQGKINQLKNNNNG